MESYQKSIPRLAGMIVCLALVMAFLPQASWGDDNAQSQAATVSDEAEALSETQEGEQSEPLPQAEEVLAFEGVSLTRPWPRRLRMILIMPWVC